ncbi:DUF4397 domain-containing protein [Kineococcus auxinigenes]|uniref:DUF4397 domain-containing protein n=1 Tax=unclassified Kineococcus TaxID=2621656 RepID=UPI003D7E8562
MRKATAAAVLVAAPAVALALPAAGATAASTGQATVSILHGVPGLTVDVYANGEEVVGGFTPGTLTDPLTLPAGSYDLAVYPAGADPASAQPAISADDVAVPAGANATVVAHLSAEGAPTLTPFVNTPADLAAGQAELTVRHVAAAPAVDVRAGGTPVLTGLSNPQEASATVPAGTVSADVVLAGTDQVALGPADLTLPEGAETIVYAWGSAADSNLALATQTVRANGSAPSGVAAGEAGTVEGGLPWWVAAGGAVALAGAGLSVVRSRAQRARS